jgi:pyruvate/2-oxoglutarate/acetoin dehydrogenase E1 component
MDREAIMRSVSKTGRLVVADEDYLNCGVTAEVLATIAERDPQILKAPAVRVANPDIPIPFSRPMENFALPDAAKIVAAAKATLRPAAA